MSVRWAGNMSGPGVHTALSRLLLLLLLVLLSGNRGTVFCQDDEDAAVEVPEVEAETEGAEAETEGAVPDGEEQPEVETVPDTEDEGGETTGTSDPPGDGSETTPTPTDEVLTETEDGANGEEVGSGHAYDLGFAAPEDSGSGEILSEEDEGLGLLLIVVPVVLVLLIVSIVSGIFIHRRASRKNRHSDVRKEDPYLEGGSEEKVPMPMFEEDVPSVLELEMDELDDWMKKDGEPTEFSQQP